MHSCHPQQSRSGAPGRLCVIGAGAWGRVIAVLLSGLGHDVRLCSARGRDLEQFVSARKRQASGSLEGFRSVEAAADGADAVFLAVSSLQVRAVARRLRPVSPVRVVSLSKGLEPGTGRRLSEIIGEELPGARICILSGGSHAEEVVQGLPFALCAASRDVRTAACVKDWLAGSRAAVTVTDDVIGVELAAVFKNIVAIAAGVADGLELGDNFRGALISLGMHELSILLAGAGARAETALGPAGLGDLLATALSAHSRNRRFGLAVGRGLSRDAAVREAGAVVEGLNALEACLSLGERIGVRLAVAERLRMILLGAAPASSIANVLE